MARKKTAAAGPLDLAGPDILHGVLRQPAGELMGTSAEHRGSGDHLRVVPMIIGDTGSNATQYFQIC